jgi:hypothetical protein
VSLLHHVLLPLLLQGKAGWKVQGDVVCPPLNSFNQASAEAH